jgi:hypothetical protein
MAGYSSQDNGRGRFGELPPLPNFGQNPIYGRKPSQPEYIPYNKRGRDFYGRLSFNMGLLWLGGFTSGAVRGFVDGWRNAASPAYKIRFNSVMNGMSKTGALWGSTLGIVGKCLSLRRCFGVMLILVDPLLFSFLAHMQRRAL